MEKIDYFVFAVALASGIYWFAFALNAYGIFHEFNDLGYFAYSMWYLIHYPRIVHGLQSLVFANHIAPVQLLVLPFFYLYQSALTLLLVQDAALALTGLVVFYAARDLLKNNLAALLLFLAFVLNPGMHGMLIFDYHAEAFITIFYLLAFYFYMKRMGWLFIASLLLLLGTIEEAPILALFLGIGLLLYAVLHEDRRMKKSGIALAAAAIIISLCALFTYSWTTQALSGGYASGAYPGLPPYLQAIPFAQEQIVAGGSFSVKLAVQLLETPVIAYGLLLVLFGFGLAVIFDPLILAVLLLPWFVQAVYVGYSPFFLIYYQYFGFSLGPVIVAAMLGLILAKKRKGALASFLHRRLGRAGYDHLYRAVVYSAAASALLFLLFSPIFVKSANINSMQEAFLFNVNATDRAAIQSLNAVMGRLPANASLMTTYFIYSHLFQRKGIELLGNQSYYFKPEYILVDFNSSISVNVGQNGQEQWFDRFMQENAANYTIIAENGTAVLYKET